MRVMYINRKFYTSWTCEPTRIWLYYKCRGYNKAFSYKLFVFRKTSCARRSFSFAFTLSDFQLFGNQDEYKTHCDFEKLFNQCRLKMESNVHFFSPFDISQTYESISAK